MKIKQSASILLVVILLLASCVSTKKDGSTKTLKFVKADKQHYVLGKELSNGKSSGTSYSVYFETKNDIKIEKVWINGINIDFEQVRTGENSFRVRSTFYGGTKSNIHDNVKAPIEYEGAALIKYLENGESKLFIVKEFKKYQSSYGN